MNSVKRLILIIIGLFIISFSLSAQNYKADRLKKASAVLELSISTDSLMPDTTYLLPAKDGKTISLRSDPMGSIEHIGIPLFNDMLRTLQPSPVYDFLEFAVLNWKYKINPNQLYLSKVIFKQGSWNTLARETMYECDCTIENREDKLYIVTWKKGERIIAVIGIPIDYELLNNDTRRNMEREFVHNLEEFRSFVSRPNPRIINEEELSIYGTEGLFVIPGQSYIIDLLNQNVYYKLTTIYETADTVINNNPITMTMEAVLPVIVNDAMFPSETFANLMMCDDNSIPEAIINLDFHLSDYHRQQITLSLSQLKAYCRQQGCKLYFASDGIEGENIRGVMFASNLPKGYNHLFSIRIPTEQLTSTIPTVHADVYLYIPPIDKEKLFGTSPTKKSGVKLKLP